MRRYMSRALHPKTATKAGELQVKVPKLRKLLFETAIIEHCKRREEKEADAMLKAIFAQESMEADQKKAADVAQKLREGKL